MSPQPFNSLNMSTSRGDTAENVRLNRQRLFDNLSIREEYLAQAKQMSGDGIRIVNSPGKYADCDAMITSSNNIFLSVLTADCVPIHIWSADAPVVAAVHSGWRGSELGILGKTIKTIHESFKVDSDSLRLVIGPGLSRDNFEVGPEFKDKFPLEYLRPIKESAKYHFDNNRFLRDTAIKLGVIGSNIETLDYCSFRDEDLFFSHRRDNEITGRMISVIGTIN